MNSGKETFCDSHKQIMLAQISKFNRSRLRDPNHFYHNLGDFHGETRHNRIAMYYKQLLKNEKPHCNAPIEDFKYDDSEFPSLQHANTVRKIEVGSSVPLTLKSIGDTLLNQTP